MIQSGVTVAAAAVAGWTHIIRAYNMRLETCNVTSLILQGHNNRCVFTIDHAATVERCCVVCHAPMTAANMKTATVVVRLDRPMTFVTAAVSCYVPGQVPAIYLTVNTSIRLIIHCDA